MKGRYKMSDKTQRKINRTIRLFNRGFKNDIAPYNAFNIHQFKASLSRDSKYDNMYLLQLYKSDRLVSSKWLDYGQITGFGHDKVGYKLYSWLNNAVVREVNK